MASTAGPAASTPAELLPGAARQALPAAASGSLWWSHGSIAAQTPRGWLDGDIRCVTGSQADGPMDDGPFVTFLPPGTPECAASAQRTRPVLVLSLQAFGEGSTGEVDLPANTVAARFPGGVVSVQRSDLGPLTSEQREQARAIVRTASSWTTNQDGCPVTNPMGIADQPRPKAWDLATAKVTALSVCQYNGMGQFMGSGRMTAAESDRMQRTIDGILAAPTGEKKGRADCDSSLGSRTLLRMTTSQGVRDAYFYADDCTLYVDDGTTKRQLGDWCAGLHTIAPFTVPVDRGPGAMCWPK